MEKVMDHESLPHPPSSFLIYCIEMHRMQHLCLKLAAKQVKKHVFNHLDLLSHAEIPVNNDNNGPEPPPSTSLSLQQDAPCKCSIFVKTGSALLHTFSCPTPRFVYNIPAIINNISMVQQSNSLFYCIERCIK